MPPSTGKSGASGAGGAGGVCASCGRPAAPDLPCRHCGAVPRRLVSELTALDKELSEMSAENVELERQRKNLAGKMQAAKHQRDVLARALAGQPSGTRRGPATDRRRRKVPAQPGPADRTPGGRPGGRPALRRRPALRIPPRLTSGRSAERPEASSRSVQAIMLGLGALLLSIAAFVFVGVTIATDAFGQLVILLGATALALGIAPRIAGRGLTSTAETVAAVGLLLLSVSGYALWATEVVALPGQVFAGLVAAATAIVGYGYHRLTGLAVPRFAALIALQPVLPLFAYVVVTGATAWAVLFTLVAAHNGLIGHLDRRSSRQAAWQRQLAWVLHGLALGAAAGYAAVALAQADTIVAASQAGVSLVMAAAVGVAGSLSLRHDPLPDLASGLMTVAVIVAAGRVAVVAEPERALLPVAAVVAAAALASRLLPDRARRGPQLASTAALAVLGAFVAVLALRAALSTVVAPPWPDGPPSPPGDPLAFLAGWPLFGAAGWQLATSAATLTVAAVAALPARVRREGATVGAALTGLAVPASFGLSPAISPWLLVAVAACLAMTGLDALTRRAGAVHLASAGAAGAAAVGAGLSSPAITAGILVALTVTGAVVSTFPARSAGAAAVTRWSAAAATLALPGATATTAAAAGAATSGVLAAAFAGVCGSLAYTVRVQLVRRMAPVPVTMATGTAALAVTVAAYAADAAVADQALTTLLLGSAVLIFAAPRVDIARRRDRMLDGSDFAAAAVTASTVATLARITFLVLPITGPDSALTVGAVLVLAAALAVRAMPVQWRRGPLLGVGVCGAVVASVAAVAALISGARSLAVVWGGDVSAWPPEVDLAGLGWGPTVALLLLAVAAIVVVPRPRVGALRPGGEDVSAALVVLATIAAPLALGMAWWGPAVLTAAVGTGYAFAAVGLGRWLPVDPRAARPRGVAAGALGLYAAGASVADAGLAAAVLALIVLVATAVAALTATLPVYGADPRLLIGGVATTGALLAAPGALATWALHLGHSGGVAFLAGLGGSSLGVAALALLVAAGPWVRPLLPYATVGVATGATIVALASLPTNYPTGVYAAAAVLLAVIVELLRAGPRPSGAVARDPATREPRHRVPGWISPPLGALVAATVPTTLALIAMAPALRAALIDPYQVLDDVFGGPPADLLRPADVPPTSALAALLLTLAAALAAAGFGGLVARQTAPVIAPGLAVTLLISPAALGMPWPAGTVAGLVVFTFAMLGVALTPPPPPGASTRVLRITRVVVLAIGLAGGSAGLAGALAEKALTWGTFGGAIAVGATAALGGRTRLARLFGWLGAAAAAQLFALTTALLVGSSRHQYGYFLIVVGAVALLAVARLPRLRRPPARHERTVVEWVGGFLSLVLALALAYGSLPDLAATLFGVGLVIGAAALWPERSDRWRRGLLWTGAASEVAAVWIILWLSGVALLEAYTVPLALFAFVVAGLERVRHRELSSWVVYGPGIIAALAPSLVSVLVDNELEPGRHAWVLVGGAVSVIFGSRRGRRAPVIIGAVVTAAGALHLLSLAVWFLPLVPLGLLLLALGANNERRQRDLDRIRGALDRMR